MTNTTCDMNSSTSTNNGCCFDNNMNSMNNNMNNQNNNISLTEKEIALDLLNSSKTNLTTLAKVLTETTNPQVRETLRNHLTACINSHYRLSDIAINKGWYIAYSEPMQQLQQDLSSAQSSILQ